MYEPKFIINAVAANIRRTRNPFGLSRGLMNRWRRGTDVPEQGGALLFTGLMYQMAPYIEKSTEYLAKFEDTKWAGGVKYAPYAPSYLTGLGLAALTPGAEKNKYDQVLKDIVRLLKASKVDFHHRPELDDYSGVLLYDLGDQETFEDQARYVAAKLKDAGVTELITVDPHTTYALKVLYPKYTGQSFTVKTYFELLDLPPAELDRKVTLHDPCFYGRYLNLADVPSKVLAGLGIERSDLNRNGSFTHCCGGPAESLSPKLAAEVGGRRLEQLDAPEAPLTAMCPICLGNLRKLGRRVDDLSAVLAAGLD